MQLAVNAVPKCPRKYRLYSVAGLAEFEQGHLPEAFVWWSRSIVAQCTVSDFQEYDPFLHMAHVAGILGAKREAQLLYTMTDAIEASAPRLDEASVQKIATVADSWVAQPLLKVLQVLDTQYLHG
jgi:hypothetical protein